MKLEDLELAINEKRDEMIAIGMTKGLSSEETIYCSQELDKLLNDYNRVLSDYEKRQAIRNFKQQIYSLQKHFFEVLWMPYSFFVENKSNRLH
nr:aspartyl-phosphate phosphatase Spo0E family protein [Neobacillus sp. Marseille-Q6967]